MTKRKKIYLFLAASAALFAAIIGLASFALNYEAPGIPPCVSLDAKLLSEKSRANGDLYRLNCDPLELTLDLAEPKAKAGARYTLFYKTRLKNVSSFDLGHIIAGVFIDPPKNRPTRDRFSLIIIRPDGGHATPRRPLQSDTQFGKADRTEYGSVIPYYNAPFPASLGELLESEYDLTWLTLKPGDSVDSIPSVLAPHTIGFGTSAPSEEAPYVGTTIGPVPAKWEGDPAPKPPPGYRILDSYVFDRPGRYRIQVSFDYELKIKPIRPYARFVPRLVEGVMGLVEFFAEIELTPSLPRRYRLQTHSAKLEFEVVR